LDGKVASRAHRLNALSDGSSASRDAEGANYSTPEALGRPGPRLDVDSLISLPIIPNVVKKIHPRLHSNSDDTRERHAKSR
jgi:hypothetical protein